MFNVQSSIASSFVSAIRRCLALMLISALALGSSIAVAQSETPPLIDPLAPGEAPKTIALVSAVGGQMNFVSARYEANKFDHFKRVPIEVPNQALNHSVLRGLERAIERIQPTSTRIMLTVRAADISNLMDSSRPRVVADDLLEQLKGFEKRKDWDLIIAVTPRYQHSGTDRMADKLWGIGAYIYGVESAKIDDDLIPFEIDTSEEVKKADGSGNTRVSKWVAPYAYLKFTVYDAKTLTILRTVDRLDARKVGNPDCIATNVFNCFTLAQYGNMIDTMAERTAAAGVTGKVEGRVTMSEPRQVK
jgi:hypothetical protein